MASKKSKSVLKREAAQKGLPAPRFDDEKRFDLTISFDNAELRELFRGWLSDGGGEQDFTLALHDERGTDIDIDYDSEGLVVVNEFPRVG